MAKTIKELAEVHAPINKEDAWDKIQKQILKQTSFEAGANTVLEVLYRIAYKEDWIANPKGGVKRFFEVCRKLKEE